VRALTELGDRILGRARSHVRIAHRHRADALQREVRSSSRGDVLGEDAMLSNPSSRRRSATNARRCRREQIANGVAVSVRFKRCIASRPDTALPGAIERSGQPTVNARYSASFGCDRAASRTLSFRSTRSRVAA
jgi:hypothetical protein